MKFAILLSLLAVAANANPISTRRNHIVKESMPAFSQGWSRHSAAPANHLIDLTFGLAQSNFAELERQLYQVSDPAHASYGKHLSKQQVNELVRPHSHTVDHVYSYFREHGISDEYVLSNEAGDFVNLRIPVGLANTMLGADFAVYRHQDGRTAVRTPQYSLPEYLHEHIDTVQPTTFLSNMRPNAATYKVLSNAEEIAYYANPPDAGRDCNNTVTVSCIRNLYRTADYTPTATNQNKFGITGYLNETANRADLLEFLAIERADAVNATFDQVLLNGGTNSQENGVNGSGTLEAALDIQFGVGIAYPTPVTFYSTGGSPPFMDDLKLQGENTNEPYLQWLNYIGNLSDSQLPKTVSTSYGDDEITVPPSYADRVCRGFAALGARGVTLFFSSGDAGVGSSNSSECFSNDGMNTSMFLPSFPASCPYVTAVGGTQNVPNEIAVTRFASGAGFSNYFGRPSYQNDTVSSYLSNTVGNMYSGLYNASGRAYPDIAALGDRYLIAAPAYYTSNSTRRVNGTNLGLIGGTSASSPAYAAVISLLNDYLLANGRSPLGFMNPALYSNLYQGHNDITVGSSFGCGTDGFPAVEGWDAVTGFGTPDFVKLQGLVLNNGTNSTSS